MPAPITVVPEHVVENLLEETPLPAVQKERSLDIVLLEILLPHEIAIISLFFPARGFLLGAPDRKFGLPGTHNPEPMRSLQPIFS
jgi:hypothetical protein